MKRILTIFVTMLITAPVAHADTLVVPGKHYVDTAIASRAPAIALATIVDTLNANNTVLKANNAIPASEKAAIGGVATLGPDGKVPASQLPAGTVPVQSDWNATTGDAAILNRPTVGKVANTLAAGDDNRFDSVPIGGAYGTGARAAIWIEP